MGYILEIFNPEPAKEVRPKKVQYNEMSQVMAEIEIYQMSHMEEEKGMLWIDSSPKGEMRFSLGKVKFIVLCVPFDFNKIDCGLIEPDGLEGIGESSTWVKTPKKTVPDMTLSMTGDDIQLTIFRDVVGINTNNPSEIFSDEFLKFLGYETKKKARKNADKKD